MAAWAQVRAAVAATLLMAGGPAPAQEAAPPAPDLGTTISPVLTLDQERLFALSLWGKRVLAEIEAQSETLGAENRRLESELTQEEADLTERRKTLDPAEFRAEADAFDEKVVAIRKAQDAKLRELTQIRDRERQAFFDAVLPLMGEVVRERGAFVILDSRAILLSVQSIDVTDAMVARIDAELGDGAGRVRPEEPGATPAPAETPPAETPPAGTPPAAPATGAGGPIAPDGAAAAPAGGD